MVISKNDHPDKFRPATDWTKQDIMYTPIPIDQLTVRAFVKNSAEVGINDFVDTIQTNDSALDLVEVTVSADNSIVPLMYVRDTEWNRLQLAKDNSKKSVSELTKATAKFTAGTEIDVCYLVPGMILSAKMANSLTVKPGVKVQSAGSGKLDLYATVNARVGHILGQFPSEASLNWAAVMITF